MNRKAIVALLLALVLVGSTVVMVIPSAFAQTASYGSATLQVSLVDLNGGKTTFADSESAQPFAILNTKNYSQIKDIEIKVRVLTPSSSDNITGVLSVTPSVQLLTRSGAYVDVTIQNPVKGVQKIADRQWYLFQGTVSVAGIDNTLQGSTEFKSELRISTKASVSYQGTIAGKTGIFYTPQLSVTVPITKTAGTAPSTIYPPTTTTSTTTTSTGTTTSGTSISTQPVTVVPTGKVYHTVGIKYVDGTSRTAVTQDLTKFSLIDPNSANAGSNIIESVTYRMWLVLDQDVFKTSQRLGFEQSTATDNYLVTVNSKGIGKSVQDKIEIFGKQYRLIELTAKAADIENVIGTSQTSGNTSFGNGILEFRIKQSTVTLTSPEKSYTVTIPQQYVTLNLGTMVVSDETGGGEVEGEIFKPAGNMQNMTVYLVGGAFLAIAGLGLVLHKRKR